MGKIVLILVLSWVVIVVLLGILGFIIKQKNEILEKLENSNKIFNSLLYALSLKLYMVREEYRDEVIEILRSYQTKHIKETGYALQSSQDLEREEEPESDEEVQQPIQDEDGGGLQDDGMSQFADNPTVQEENSNIVYLENYRDK